MLYRGLRQNLRQHLEESSDSLFSLEYEDFIELIQSIDRRIGRPQKLTPRSVRVFRRHE